MSGFWTWGNYVSWEHCIEANRICNLDNCPDTMNCCVSNCVGMPTLFGLLIAVLVAGIFTIAVTIITKLLSNERNTHPLDNVQLNKRGNKNVKTTF